MTFRPRRCKLALESQECQQSAAPSASGGDHGHQQPQKENTCRGHRGIHPHGGTGRLKGHRRERGPRLFLGHDPQRACGAGRHGLSRAAAHVGGPRAHAARLPDVRQRAHGAQGPHRRRDAGHHAEPDGPPPARRTHDGREPPCLAADELPRRDAHDERRRDHPPLRPHLSRREQLHHRAAAERRHGEKQARAPAGLGRRAHDPEARHRLQRPLHGHPRERHHSGADPLGGARRAG